MKYLKYFLIAGVTFLSLTSTTTKTSGLSEGVYPGDLFADINNLESTSGTNFSLSGLKGQKVLVNLWAAYDANSRKDNVFLANVIEKADYPVRMISISFDKSKSVFEKTVALDKVDADYQFIAEDNVYDELFSRFQLKKGFKNYLIDENGVIVAVNVTSEDLNQLLKKN